MSVGSVNRYSALELDDEGNIVQSSKTTKPAAVEEEHVAPAIHATNTRSQLGSGLSHQQKKQQQHQQLDDAAAPSPAANQGEQKPRARVSDRNRRGRGGAGGPGAPHRGGYIGDGEKREFDRRGAPGDDRPRGRPRKGPNSLGRFGDDDNHRRNRPHKNADATTEEASATPADGASTPADATATPNAEAATPADAATPVDGAAPAADATAESTDAAALEAAAAAAAALQEEEDKTLTFEEYQAQLKAKAVEADVSRQLRVVEINDKQWKKVNAAPDAKKKKSVLTVSGQEILVEEAVKPQAERVEKKKKMLSLDEFVGTVAPAATESAGPSGSSEYRGRGREGGRGRGAGRGRGGRGGRGVAVPIADKDAFPDLSAAKKN